jgi:hypothetical protein
MAFKAAETAHNGLAYEHNYFHVGVERVSHPLACRCPSQQTMMVVPLLVGINDVAHLALYR